MPAQYTDVTINEMDEFISSQGFKALVLPGTVERVYGRRVDRDGLQLTLRVYTGINPNGHSREVGADAIRCHVFWRDGTGTVRPCGGSKRVHRVKGWRKNLQSRLDAFEDLLGPQCPNCEAPMVERTSKGKKFWGCSTYPTCKCTMQVTKNVKT